MMNDSDPTSSTRPDSLLSSDRIIPIIEEEAHVTKRLIEIEHVRVRTSPVEEQVVVRDEVVRERVDVTRVAIDREVAAAPEVRTEGDVTIVPVLEERLVVEKRLVLVEELHIRRIATTETVEIPTTLRRTAVEIDRAVPDRQEVS